MPGRREAPARQGVLGERIPELQLSIFVASHWLERGVQIPTGTGLGSADG